MAGDGSAPLPFPLGANGITYRHNTVFVTNTELGSVVAVPVDPDGSPGTPAVLVQSPTLAGADGVALDVHGGLYVAVIAQSTIVHIGRDGTLTTLADAADGLDFASSLAFGTGRGLRTTLFIVNFSVGPFFGEPIGAGPALLSLEVGVPGLPQP